MVETVVSADGTPIAVQRDETDPARPALLIVQGAFCDRSTGASLAAGLRRRFTVYRLDRRGRGDSGDTPPWSTEREVQDLAAVVDHIGEAPFVYGHSAGAALSLEAAAAGVPTRRLVVYEPPYVGAVGAPGSQAGELQALIADGRPEAAVARFLIATGAPPGAIAGLRDSPAWPAMVALAHVLPYDVGLANGGVAPIERLERITIPVLGAAGGWSPDWALHAADAIAAAVPRGQARLLEGQTHRVADAAILPVLTEFFV